MPSQTLQTDEMPVSTSESRELVARLAASFELRRAARLRTFLLYVCDRTFSHDAQGMHEQDIGVSVFGRSPGYDTGVDNIVRVNATELRKRLERYFLEEGAAEEVILEIQRGSYRPVFRRRSASTETAQLPVAVISPQAAEQRESESLPVAVEPAPVGPSLTTLVSTKEGRTGSVIRWWRAATVLLLVCCTYLAWQVRELKASSEPWRNQPALHAFWKNFFVPGAQANIVMADTSFAIAEDMMQRPVNLDDYVDYNYRRFAESPGLSATQRTDLGLVLVRNTSSVADFRVAQQILLLAPTDPGRPILKFSREYAAGEAKSNSLILIGSRQSNPWVGLFADKLNFDLTYDVAVEHPSIVNRHPAQGEPAFYQSPEGARKGATGYAVIAYLPGLSENHSTLIVEGTDSQATGAAGDFLTNEDSMRSLSQKFPGGKIPYFELVMRTSQLNGIPLQGEVIALRTYGSR